MSGSDDLLTDMAFLSSSDHSEQLISGRIAPDDLPDDLARVARLLTALRSPTVSDAAGEQEAVVTIVAAIAAAPISLETARRRRMLPQLLTAKAAAAAAVVLLAGTGAAAATGSLPDVAQSRVADALAKVDVSIPKPSGDHARPGSHGTQPGDHGSAVGPDTTRPAMKGLCTAWAARSKGDDNRGNSGDSVAFANLRHRAHDAGVLVKEYCHDVLSADPGSDGADHSQRPTDAGSAGADHGRRDHGQPVDGTHGQSGADHGAQNSEHPTPAGTTPESGIDTGSTASDGANSGGVDHAAPPAAAGSDSSTADHGAPTSPGSSPRP